MFAAKNTAAPSGEAVYIESVFSTYLYTGDGATTRAISNQINLSTYGGLVWLKQRSGTADHYLCDTARGATKIIRSNLTSAEFTGNNSVKSFDSSGFSVGTDTNINGSGSTYASWTFRKQAKFFDVVTYTGTGTARTVAHNLGSVPGMIIVKRNGAIGEWNVYHRSLATNQYLTLESTAAVSTSASYWNNTAPTSTEFSVSSVNNTSSNTYVAYLFAHDAGGFGASGSDNVITCGSFTTDGSENSSTTLGYEPQWLLIKKTSAAQDWYLADNMRGLNVAGQDDAFLYPNLSSAEGLNNRIGINSTGFTTSAFGASSTFIYIAIRRGPMKTPTSGTSVFSPVAYTGNGANNRAITTGFVPDMVWWKGRSNGTDWKDATLLIGTGRALTQNSTGAEGSVAGYYINTYNNTGFTYGTSDSSYNTNTWTYVVQGFSRAPGFFDVVCYSNAGAPTTVVHNLGVEPELIITKRRNGVYDWIVYSKTLGASKVLFLNLTDAQTTFTCFANVGATSFQTFSPANDGTQVAYLFATLAGVSKVGSYTGTGALQTINCGFSSGARFVLIKRTDSTGDWWVYDSTRGITSGNDPYLFLNSTAAEVTNTNYVDTASTGFQVTAAAPAGLNANGGTYIFLAIA